MVKPHTQLRLKQREQKVILILVDLFIAIFALLLGLYFWAQRDSWFTFNIEFLKTRPPFWFYLLPFFWIILLLELYDLHKASRKRDTLLGVLFAAIIGAVIYLIIYFSSEPNSLPRRGVAVFLIAVSLLTIIWRLIFIRIFITVSRQQKVLIIGAGKAGTTIAQLLKEMKPPPFLIIGFIDDDPGKQNMIFFDLPVLGGGDRLLEIIEERGITDLIFAISGEMIPTTFRALVTAEEHGVEITTMPIVYEEYLGRVPIFLLQSDWLLRSFVDQYHSNAFYEAIKRLIDLVFSILGVVIFFILLPIISLMITIDDGFPIFLKQTRLGKSGKEYKIVKFRSMVKDAESGGIPQQTQKQDPRITRFGKFLRASHLDELPQFLNVFKGEMSLIGPRAERPEYVDQLQKVIPFYRARLFVKPGLTGWAQINQRYASSTEESGIKLEYDLYYIKKRNILLDLIIFTRTIGIVLRLGGQ